MSCASRANRRIIGARTPASTERRPMRHPAARPRVMLLFTLVTLTIPQASMAGARVSASKDDVQAGPALGGLCGAAERAGWPQQINGSGHYLSGAPVTVDLDGDGAQEIVAADVSGRVWVLSHIHISEPTRLLSTSYAVF